MSACAGIATPGGVILGTEVEGGTVVCACTEIMGPGSVILGVMVGGGRVRSGRGVGFHALPQSLSSHIWVIVNTMALTLDNADTPCCEPAVLGSRTQAFRLGDAHLLSGLRP